MNGKLDEEGSRSGDRWATLLAKRSECHRCPHSHRYHTSSQVEKAKHTEKSQRIWNVMFTNDADGRSLEMSVNDGVY